MAGNRGALVGAGTHARSAYSWKCCLPGRTVTLHPVPSPITAQVQRRERVTMLLCSSRSSVDKPSCYSLGKKPTMDHFPVLVECDKMFGNTVSYYQWWPDALPTPSLPRTSMHLSWKQRRRRKKLPNLGSNSWSSLPGSYPLTSRPLGTLPEYLIA